MKPEDQEYITMETLHPNIVWASKPGCSKAVAEIWIGDTVLWMVIFINDATGTLKMELFPLQNGSTSMLIDFSEAEIIIQSAKQELLTYAAVK